MAKDVIQIVEMSRHFLYLPLYYAKLHNFFGRLPPDVQIEIVSPLEATDAAASLSSQSRNPNRHDCAMAPYSFNTRFQRSVAAG